MAMTDFTDIGCDYAITLRQWRSSWEKRRAEIQKLGYSDQFWRKYRMYFAYCEAGFDCRYILTYQISFKKGPATNDEAPVVPEGANVDRRPQSERGSFSGLDHITQVRFLPSLIALMQSN